MVDLPFVRTMVAGYSRPTQLACLSVPSLCVLGSPRAPVVFEVPPYTRPRPEVTRDGAPGRRRRRPDRLHSPRSRPTLRRASATQDSLGSRGRSLGSTSDRSRKRRVRVNRRDGKLHESRRAPGKVPGLRSPATKQSLVCLLPARSWPGMLPALRISENRPTPQRTVHPMPTDRGLERWNADSECAASLPSCAVCC